MGELSLNYEPDMCSEPSGDRLFGAGTFLIGRHVGIVKRQRRQLLDVMDFSQTDFGV